MGDPALSLGAERGGEPYRVVMIDDEERILRTYSRIFQRAGFEVSTFHQPVEAVAHIEEHWSRYDVIITDINMPDLDGLSVLARLGPATPLPIIMLTADTRPQTIVSALRAGAFNYVAKPPTNIDELVITLERAAGYGRLAHRARDLEQRAEIQGQFERLVGSSEPMREVFATVAKIAATDVNILIHGESGTGKELAARAVHARSNRAANPFVALNCAALPDALIDSELFGHEKGAFTGAVGARPGVFVEADTGTLFLDEIGDLPPNIQQRLLRVLQEREVRPVGGTGIRKVDVRVIGATHVDLDEAASAGRFRSDLYYRLNVVSLHLPPLRDRGGDIALLAAHLLKKHAALHNRKAPQFAPDAMAKLLAYAWPGNVRELENVIQRALAFESGDTIGKSVLPAWAAGVSVIAPPAAAEHAAAKSSPDDFCWSDDMTMADARKEAQRRFERAYLTRLLDRAGGNISEAARRAGVDRSNFKRVLARHKLRGGD